MSPVTMADASWDGGLLRLTEWPRERQGEPCSFIEVPGDRAWGMPWAQLMPEAYRLGAPPLLDLSASLSLGAELEGVR